MSGNNMSTTVTSLSLAVPSSRNVGQPATGDGSYADRKFIVQVTVPAVLVSIFLLIILIIYLKCGRKIKRCEAVGVKGRQGRTDGTVKVGTWKRVRPTSTMRERKLPPIPEESQEDNKETFEDIENDQEVSSGDTSPEGHVYAEISTSDHQINEQHHESQFTVSGSDERPSFNSSPSRLGNIPDVVQQYVQIPDQTQHLSPHRDRAAELPYVYPYHDITLDRTSLRNLIADDAQPYYVTSFQEDPSDSSGPNSLASTMSTFLTSGGYDLRTYDNPSFSCSLDLEDSEADHTFCQHASKRRKSSSDLEYDDHLLYGSLKRNNCEVNCRITAWPPCEVIDHKEDGLRPASVFLLRDQKCHPLEDGGQNELRLNLAELNAIEPSNCQKNCNCMNSRAERDSSMAHQHSEETQFHHDHVYHVPMRSHVPNSHMCSYMPPDVVRERVHHHVPRCHRAGWGREKGQAHFSSSIESSQPYQDSKRIYAKQSRRKGSSRAALRRSQFSRSNANASQQSNSMEKPRKRRLPRDVCGGCCCGSTHSTIGREYMYNNSESKTSDEFQESPRSRFSLGQDNKEKTPANWVLLASDHLQLRPSEEGEPRDGYSTF